MLRKANNVYSVLLSDASVTVANVNSGVAAGAVVTDANLPAGAVVLCDINMKRLDASSYATIDRFFVVQGKGAGVPLMKSPIITKATMSMTTSKFVPAAQQVTYVGYNLTSGALSAANNTKYWIKIRKRDNDAANRSQPMSLFAGPIMTDASATQEEVAFALMKNGIKNFAQEPANGYLKFEVVSDGTLAAIGTATLAVANGSKTVTYSAAHSLAVGDLVFIAGATYKVATVVSSTVITLNVAFQGTAQTALATGTTYASTHGKITSAANFGVRLTGVEAPFNVNTFRDYYANRFTVTFSDSTVPVTSTGANDGSGVWQKVAMDEYMNYGFEGQNNQLAVPSVPRDQVVKIPGVAGNTALTCKYGTLNIYWEETITGLVSRDGGKGNVMLRANLNNVSGAGVLSTTNNAYDVLFTVLGLSAANFNE